jgi:hypothetical protein
VKHAFLAWVAASSLVVGGSSWAEGLRPFLGGGFTVGGDKINTIHYTNGDDATLRAGGLLDLRAGVDYRLIGLPISLQGTMAYHTDRASARNGSADFSRTPLELLVQWHANERWAIGAGVRKATGARYNASGAGASQTADQSFKSATGYVIEGEYAVIPSVGLKLRYVNEEYTASDNASIKKDGSHMGLLAVYYFR